MSNRRSVFERPRTDGHQRAHAVIQDGHQSLRRPPRAGDYIVSVAYVTSVVVSDDI